jgi:rhodanese-related sulfurtransferase
VSKKHSSNRNPQSQQSQQKPQPQPARKSQSGRLPVWAIVAGAAALIVIVIAVVLVTNQGSQGGAAVQALPREITVQQAASMRDAGAFILDVREPSEWADFHIPNATLIPLGQLEARVKEVPAGKDVVVVCRSGNRSATGRDILLKAGFTRVTSMTGGVTQWKVAGLPTQSGS